MSIQLWQSKAILSSLKNFGVQYFAYASGARNAALILELLKLRGIERFSFFDERALAFHALGWAKAKRQIAAVIITSGSALANCWPALLEAAKSEHPLLILSAARPDELSFVKENQALAQKNFFAPFVVSSLSWPLLADEDFGYTSYTNKKNRNVFEKHLNTKLKMLFAPLEKRLGPMHINIPFAEPLVADTASKKKKKKKKNFIHPEIVFHKNDFEKFERSFYGYEKARKGIRSLKAGELAELFAPLLIEKKTRGLIICGQTNTSDFSLPIANVITKLSNTLSWPVFADVLSPLYCYAAARKNENQPMFLLEASLENDKLLEREAFQYVLHLGSSFVSKKLLAFFRENKPKIYAHIDTDASLYNPAFCVTHRVAYPDTRSLEMVLRLMLKSIVKTKIKIKTTTTSSFSKKNPIRLNSVKQNRLTTATVDVLDNAFKKKMDAYRFSSFCELSIVRALKNFSLQTSERLWLFLGNSMPIRSFGHYPSMHGFHKVLGSRGLSGIDGLLSTACGAAASTSSRDRFLVLLGDLTALYDMNALLLVNDLAKQQRKKSIGIIIINNGGGGIFRTLPIIKHFKRGEHRQNFLFKHSYSFKNLSKAAGFLYAKVGSERSFSRVLPDMFRKKKNFIVEAFIDGEKSFLEQRKFQSYIAKEFLY